MCAGGRSDRDVHGCLAASSTISNVTILNPWGAGFPITTGRIEVYAPGAIPGVDTPIFNSGTQTFSAAGEISFTPATAQSGVGLVHIVSESSTQYPCIGEIGVIGSQP